MKRILVPADDLLELIEAHDSWAGALHPDDRQEYLDRFAHLKAKAKKAIEQPEAAFEYIED